MFGKTIQNNREGKDMQLITNEKIRNRLASSVYLNGSKCICFIYIYIYIHIIYTYAYT